jgi:nitroreductase
MDLFDAINTRYSYRGAFTDAPIPEADLRCILESAIRAPSACNKQGPRFVVVRDPDVLAAIAQVVDRPVVHTAKAIVLLLADHCEVYRGFEFGAEDCAAAAQNMLLAITALGYASVWLDGALRCDDVADQLAVLLQVPSHLRVRILLPIGVPAEPGQPTDRLPIEERVWFDHCG